MPLNALRAFAALALLALGSATGALAADTVPRPRNAVTIIVPYTHGGPTDHVAQPLVQALSRALGRKVIERNIRGVGGTLGAEKVAKAKPDGNTLLLSNIGHATSVALYRKLRYDPLADFAPIGLVADVPMTLVGRPKLPPNTFQELRAYIDTRKDKVTYGHAGPGSASYLCGLKFMDAIDTRLASVPYHGTKETRIDLIGGHIDLTCDQITNTLSSIKARRMKPFGVTDVSRLPELPQVPTLSEAGLTGFQLVVWHGLYAPKGTPAPVIERLTSALQQALADPQLRASYARLGARPATAEEARPQALQARLAAEVETWEPLIRKASPYRQ